MDEYIFENGKPVLDEKGGIWVEHGVWVEEEDGWKNRLRFRRRIK